MMEWKRIKTPTFFYLNNYKWNYSHSINGLTDILGSDLYHLLYLNLSGLSTNLKCHLGYSTVSTSPPFASFSLIFSLSFLLSYYQHLLNLSQLLYVYLMKLFSICIGKGALLTTVHTLRIMKFPNLLPYSHATIKWPAGNYVLHSSTIYIY